MDVLIEGPEADRIAGTDLAAGAGGENVADDLENFRRVGSHGGARVHNEKETAGGGGIILRGERKKRAGEREDANE